MTEPTPDSPDDGIETRVVEIHGRAIVVRRLTDTQLMFLNRESWLLQQPATPDRRKIDGIRRVFDTLESQVVQDADKDYLMDLMAARKLELKDMMGFIEAFVGDQKVEQPKVRRGRRPAVR